MPRIHVLPPGLVNQIAAGEVVERPASIVKELVENALDAGATAIGVDVEEGGLALVRVADDGSGMDRDDALLALERHATSKLRDAQGLAAIGTMGFRGEAVPAIASVSRFRLDTSPGDDGAGTRVELEGGVLGEVAPVARPRGTTVEVRDLFFNTPARRKFMRAASTEAGHVSEAVIRLALARPDVGFTLRSGGRLVLGARAGGGLADRAGQALGREAHRHLLPVDARRGDVRVHGLVCSPDHSEATGRALYLFVNGRYVRDRSAAHAVLRAFAGTLPPGRHPAGVLFVELPLDRVDVNVHPQKLEVRFAEGREVFDALFHTVAGALRTAPWLRARPQAAPAGDGVPGGAGGEAAPVPVPVAGEEAAEVLAWARAARPPEGSGATLVQPAPGAWATGRLAFPIAPAPDAGPDAAPRPEGYFAGLRYVGQHARTYLLCEAPGGTLVVIDQHASHERMLFHRLREAFRARRIPVQPFLLPQVVTLPPAAARALESGLAELGRLGFDAEPFGGEAFAVKGAPAALAGVDLTALLTDLGSQLAEVERGSAVDDAFHDLLATMACHAAVRANQDVSPEEARALLDGLDAIDFKARCPHGRPVVFELSLADLERRVGRR
ncbi:DNA mismatch repair endonuclease MutL [Anaeromyxobacter sp. PSR-1]|uniref:DNA mismatch repair endonuclease MutL n=1 Tax=unclassified Anaeromyxobacter TaxID=2620896 RepID=UPI0005E066EA|nr:DNA mismatch repair endonuclease MutL [Anaeromyxobacter sp. PSR-1]GAO05141.1 DNA mismatch repair protein MutL [Anaeromyxobacter sp. PSR-1]